MILGRGSDAISPTAHYTGHVWVRNGLSHPELATLEGRLFHTSLEGVRLATGGILDKSLLERHRLIDAALEEEIDAGRIGQVLEVAAGMSPRGWRFAERHGDAITYVEADLPAMAERKRRALARMGTLGDSHRVVELDALADEGPASLGAVTRDLEPERGLAIITEGLLTYLERDAVLALWRRLARASAGFSHRLYLSDLRLGEDAGVTERVFYLLLGAFVRGPAGIHFQTEAEAIAALQRAGFDDARLHRGTTGAIHVIDAR